MCEQCDALRKALKEAGGDMRVDLASVEEWQFVEVQASIRQFINHFHDNNPELPKPLAVIAFISVANKVFEEYGVQVGK